jgi:hypothetical protein
MPHSAGRISVLTACNTDRRLLHQRPVASALRLSVRTLAFHAGERGSIPLGRTTTFFFSCMALTAARTLAGSRACVGAGKARLAVARMGALKRRGGAKLRQGSENTRGVEERSSDREDSNARLPRGRSDGDAPPQSVIRMLAAACFILSMYCCWLQPHSSRSCSHVRTDSNAHSMSVACR